MRFLAGQDETYPWPVNNQTSRHQLLLHFEFCSLNRLLGVLCFLPDPFQRRLSPSSWMQRKLAAHVKENVDSVEVAKNPEANHASARWHPLPSGVPFLGPEGPCGYQVEPEAQLIA